MIPYDNEDILEIQEGGIDYYGEPLKKDGWGPRTAWWAGILSLPVQRRLIVCAALKYYKLGIKDDGNNRGHWPDEFLKPAGLIGKPWCVAMTSYILRNEAWFTEDVWPYHTSTLKLIEWAEKNNRVVKEPLPGDLSCFMHNETEGHTDINLATNKYWVLNVGGNLSNTVKVGKRARDGLTFIRTVDVEGSKLACPPLESVLNLDGTRTR